MEENKVSRQKAQEDSANGSIQDEDTSVLDNLLEKLRNGDTVGRRARRPRPSAENRPPVPNLTTDGIVIAGEDTADIARDMLARLQSDGFQAFPTASAGPSARRQTRRRRTGTNLSISGVSDLDLTSPGMVSASLPDVSFDPGSQVTDPEAEA